MRLNFRFFSLKKLDLALVILIGIVPVVWLKQGYLIAKGDYFPFWLNPSKTVGSDVFLWTSNMMGHADPIGSFMTFEFIWLLFTSFGLVSIFAQILIQILFFMGAGLSMYFLARTVYPELRLAPMIAGTFYMFNFFVFQNKLNDGIAWTYMFLPLLMAMLVRTLEAADKKNAKEESKNTVYFAVTSMVTLSFASINPANVVIIFLVMAITFVSYFVSQSQTRAHILRKGTKLVVISALINLWWIVPILNYYLWSSAALNPAVDVTVWSWTHQRASFLNLLWLNGGWSWRPEYVPYIDSYSNSFLLLLTFAPFLLASATLLFKSKRSRLSALFMLAILTLLFLAKGLHEPFGQVNSVLYARIPGMVMFREPQSKFTMALMPFLSLLVGASAHHIANMNLGKRKPSCLTKTAFAGLFILMIVASTYPMVTNPIETKTPQLPFSSYVQIPEYWYDATEWLNKQPGDYRILVTPPNDFYAMPYTWGYYGTDDFLTRFIQKPLLLTYYSSYKIDDQTARALDYLGKTISGNKTAHFKALLDLLNVRYILQRNDVMYNFTGRKILSPMEMEEFIAQLSYIHLDKRFGQLDIYEYTNAKPYIYTLDVATFQRTKIEIERVQTLDRSWDYANSKDFDDWQENTLQNQFGATQNLSLDNSTLKLELWNSTWGWKTISSPLLPAEYGTSYRIGFDIKGQDAHQVHIKTMEFDLNQKILTGTYNTFINDGTFNWTHITFNYESTSRTTRYLQLQIWHGHETNKPLPNIIWLDNVRVDGYATALSTAGLDLIFSNSTENQPATILDYSKVNPTKTTATIDATQPFILALTEALDDSWTASVNGKQYRPIPLYLGLKGFQIDQTGLLQVTIEYEPQHWFFYGSIISATTVLVCLTYLAYDYSESKAIWQYVKTAFAKKKNQQYTDKEGKKTESNR